MVGTRSRIELVSEDYAVIGGEVRHYPPMICGLSAFLTDELPDDIAFAVFESSNLPLNQGYWETDRGFETLDEAVKYIKQCQSDGYVIVDLECRDF